MAFSATNEGAAEIKKTATNIKEAAEAIVTAADTLKKSADKIKKGLGPDQPDLMEVLEGIKKSMKGSESAVNAISKKMRSVGIAYAGIAGKKPFSKLKNGPSSGK